MHLPICAAYFTKQPCNRYTWLEARCGIRPRVEFENLEGFHIRAAWRMAGKRPMKLPDGTWTYPNLVQALEDVGLKTIAHYIAVRRHHIANCFVNEPIFMICVDGLRTHGSSNRHFHGSNRWIWKQLGWHALHYLQLFPMSKRSIATDGNGSCG